jgi:coatomer subunit beta
VDDDLLDDDDDTHDLTRALGGKVPNSSATLAALKSDSTTIATKLNRVYQLTGFSDPVYVESHLQVQDYDIVLDMLVVNQTTSILQNLQIELHTSGDLRVVERPQSYTIAPAGPNATGVQRIHATIKLTSTESGVIFGNVVYDNASGTTKTIVVLNNIHLDVIDYISPATCSDVAFRAMWAEFEWENKVAVNTDIADLSEYLDHVLAITNMKCMTPQNTMSGSAAFLAANLYARSMFGEDALLNLSVEKQQKSGKVGGYIRIRSKTQGIALSLGDKIQQFQKRKEKV